MICTSSPDGRELGCPSRVNEIIRTEATALLIKANATDVQTDWQQISERSLAQFIDSAGIFLDLKGWRYYLPAYIVWSLRQCLENDDMGSLYWVVHYFLLQGQKTS